MSWDVSISDTEESRWLSSSIIQHRTPTLHRARIITETILEQFEEEQLDEVYIIYTNMVNSVTTEPQMLRLLPIVKERFITKDGQDLSMYQDPLVMTPSPESSA